jgi:hypothetical protein
MIMKNRRLAELAGLIHRSTVESKEIINESFSSSARQRNKLARRSMKYGQDSPELERLRQTHPDKNSVIDQWDLFWNDETKTWFHSYYDRNGKRAAYDTGVGDQLDPHRAAVAVDNAGVSDEADFLRSSGQVGAMLENRLLLEEEDEGGGEVDIFGDEGGDDAGGDEGGEDLFGDDEEEADAGGEGEGEEAAADEKEEKPEEAEVEELSAKDIANFGTGEIDAELDQVFINIFDKAMSRADVRSKTSLGYPGKQSIEDLEESLSRYNMKALLVEEESPEEKGTLSARDFDMAYFSDEIMRYITNYDTLLDIEGMIFNKARQFLLNQFNAETAREFEEFMARIHGFDPQEKFDNDEPSALTSPVAVGGSAAAAGA